MNYIDIVMQGLKGSNRKNLKDYFFSEQKKAEAAQFISADLFYSGCMEVIDSFKGNINAQIFERKKELYQLELCAESGAIDLQGKTIKQRKRETLLYCEQELKNERPDGIGSLTFRVNLPSVNNNLFLSGLSYSEVIEIEDTINELWHRTSTEASATEKSKDNRPKAEPKPVIDLISEAKIEECFKQKFIDLLKGEFINSQPKEFALMLKAMKQEGILKPAYNIVYYEAFEAYFGKKYGSDEAKNKFMRAKNDEEVLLGYKKQIGNIINKSKIK